MATYSFDPSNYSTGIDVTTIGWSSNYDPVTATIEDFNGNRCISWDRTPGTLALALDEVGSTTDCEVTILCDQLTDGIYGAMLRAPSSFPAEPYEFVADQGGSQSDDLAVYYSTQTLAITQKTYGNPFALRARASGTTLSVKTWVPADRTNPGADEPTSWDLNFSDNNRSSGVLGLYVKTYPSGSGPWRIYYFGAADSGDTAPLPTSSTSGYVDTYSDVFSQEDSFSIAVNRKMSLSEGMSLSDTDDSTVFRTWSDWFQVTTQDDLNKIINSFSISDTFACRVLIGGSVSQTYDIQDTHISRLDYFDSLSDQFNLTDNQVGRLLSVSYFEDTFEKSDSYLNRMIGRSSLQNQMQSEDFSSKRYDSFVDIIENSDVDDLIQEFSKASAMLSEITLTDDEFNQKSMVLTSLIETLQTTDDYTNKVQAVNRFLEEFSMNDTIDYLEEFLLEMKDIYQSSDQYNRLARVVDQLLDVYETDEEFREKAFKDGSIVDDSQLDDLYDSKINRLSEVIDDYFISSIIDYSAKKLVDYIDSSIFGDQFTYTAKHILTILENYNYSFLTNSKITINGQMIDDQTITDFVQSVSNMTANFSNQYITKDVMKLVVLFDSLLDEIINSNDAFDISNVSRYMNYSDDYETSGIFDIFISLVGTDLQEKFSMIDEEKAYSYLKDSFSGSIEMNDVFDYLEKFSKLLFSSIRIVAAININNINTW